LSATWHFLARALPVRLVGIASYTTDLAPLEKIMRDALVFPLYDGGNQGAEQAVVCALMSWCWGRPEITGRVSRVRRPTWPVKPV